MTDNEKPSNNPQSLNVLTQFLKDLSFENPANGPLFVGEKNVSPEINLNVQINVEKDTNEKTHFYVSLNLKAISKSKRNLYLY